MLVRLKGRSELLWRVRAPLLDRFRDGRAFSTACDRDRMADKARSMSLLKPPKIDWYITQPVDAASGRIDS